MASIKDRLHEIDDPGQHNNHLVIWPQDIQYGNGDPIWIRIPGFCGNPEDPDGCNLMIEYYDGRLRVHFWNRENDSNAECLTISASESVRKAIEAPLKELPLLLSDPDSAVVEIVEQRLKEKK